MIFRKTNRFEQLYIEEGTTVQELIDLLKAENADDLVSQHAFHIIKQTVLTKEEAIEEVNNEIRETEKTLAKFIEHYENVLLKKKEELIKLEDSNENN